MFRVKIDTISEILRNKFKVIEYIYTTRYSEYYFKEANISFKVTKFSISSRGSRLFNRHTDQLLKITNSLPIFKAKFKDNLIKLKGISIYSQ